MSEQGLDLCVGLIGFCGSIRGAAILMVGDSGISARGSGGGVIGGTEHAAVNKTAAINTYRIIFSYEASAQ